MDVCFKLYITEVYLFFHISQAKTIDPLKTPI